MTHVTAVNSTLSPKCLEWAGLTLMRGAEAELATECVLDKPSSFIHCFGKEHFALTCEVGGVSVDEACVVGVEWFWSTVDAC